MLDFNRLNYSKSQPLVKQNIFCWQYATVASSDKSQSKE